MNKELIRLKKICEYRKKMLDRQWDRFDAISPEEYTKQLAQQNMCGTSAHYYAEALEKYIEALERILISE